MRSHPSNILFKGKVDVEEYDYFFSIANESDLLQKIKVLSENKQKTIDIILLKFCLGNYATMFNIDK